MFILIGFLLIGGFSTSVDICYELYGNADGQHGYAIEDFRAFGDYCYARFRNPDGDSRTQNAMDAKHYCYSVFPEGTIAQPHTDGEFDVLTSYQDRLTVGILMDGSSFRWAGGGGVNGWGGGIDSTNIETPLKWYDGVTPTAANAGSTHDFATVNTNSPGDGFKIWHNKNQKDNQLTYDFVCQMVRGSILSGGTTDNGEQEFQGVYDEVSAINTLLQDLEDDLLDEVALQQALMNDAYDTKILEYNTLVEHLNVYKAAVDDYHVSYTQYSENMNHLNDELEIVYVVRKLLGDQIGVHQQQVAIIEPINESHEGLDCIG